MFWKYSASAYFMFLSWQLLSPVTLIQAGGNDKLYHIAGFFVLAALTLLAWHRRYSIVPIGFGLVAYGLFTECAQYFIMGRNFSLLDWLADAFGILLACCLFFFYSKRA